MTVSSCRCVSLAVMSDTAIPLLLLLGLLSLLWDDLYLYFHICCYVLCLFSYWNCTLQDSVAKWPSSACLVHLAIRSNASCTSVCSVSRVHWTVTALNINPLTPNDHYSGRTAPLTSKRYILYIYSTNICTEYFKHGIHSPFFFIFKMQFVS